MIRCVFKSKTAKTFFAYLATISICSTINKWFMYNACSFFFLIYFLSPGSICRGGGDISLPLHKSLTYEMEDKEDVKDLKPEQCRHISRFKKRKKMLRTALGLRVSLQEWGFKKKKNSAKNVTRQKTKEL